MTDDARPQGHWGLSAEIARVLRDVEQVFRESEARVEAILRTAADAIITIHATGEIETFNPAAERMFGYAASEVVGRNVTILMRTPHRQRHNHYIAEYLLSGESDIVGHSRRLHGQRRDGTVFPLELSVSEVRLGTRRLFTGIARDISEREATERKLRASRRFLRATLDSLPQHIAILDASGVILEVNQAWKKFARANRMLGNSQGVGCNYLEVCQDSARLNCPEAAEVADGIVRVIRGEQEHFQLEYPCHGEEEQRWFALHVTRFESDDGPRAVVAHENITSRKLGELELAAAKEVAESANVRRSEFLAMLGHELRNPLAPIRHASELLQREDLPETVRQQAVRTLAEQTAHMVHLVDDLLDLTRIDHGKIRIQLRPLDLCDCVRRAVESTHVCIQQRQHDFVIQMPERGVPVLGDADRLQQVIDNLLNNAARYTPVGGRIELSLVAESSDAVITVRDNGIGMSKAELARVFDAFTQAGGIGADGNGGLGLGLTLVRRLVELHEGTVQASSDGPQQGSRFVVRLPLLPEAFPESAPTGTSRPRSAPSVSRQILIVDDNQAAADMLAALLEMEGHRATAAYDGQTGLDQARRTPPDVILLDLRMPRIDGFEVARRLRSAPETAGVCLVAMTGLGRESDVQRSLEHGFDGHLVKPIQPDQLQALLNDLPRSHPVGSS